MWNKNTVSNIDVTLILTSASILLLWQILLALADILKFQLVFLKVLLKRLQTILCSNREFCLHVAILCFCVAE